MRSRSSLQSLVTGPLAAVAVAAATLATPAQAVIISGQWDPAFGPTQPNLGYRGTASFYLPDACLSPGNGGVVENGDVDGCAPKFDLATSIYMISAYVDFYDLSDVATTLETLVFVDPADAPLPDKVFAVELSEAGVDEVPTVIGSFTDWYGPKTSGLAQASNGTYYLSFGNVIFTIVPVSRSDASTDVVAEQRLPGDYFGDFAAVRLVGGGSCTQPGDPSCPEGTQAFATYRVAPSAVPAPGSLALAALAMAGAALALRRRRR